MQNGRTTNYCKRCFMLLLQDAWLRSYYFKGAGERRVGHLARLDANQCTSGTNLWILLYQKHLHGDLDLDE